jgi:hypothetical protein
LSAFGCGLIASTRSILTLISDMISQWPKGLKVCLFVLTHVLDSVLLPGDSYDESTSCTSVLRLEHQNTYLMLSTHLSVP